MCDLFVTVLAMVLRDLCHELLVPSNCYNSSSALIITRLQDRNLLYGS